MKDLCVVVDVLAHLLSNEAAKSLLMDITIVVSSLVVCVALIHAFAFREATRRKASEEEKNILDCLVVYVWSSEKSESFLRKKFRLVEETKARRIFFTTTNKKQNKKLFPTKKNQRGKKTRPLTFFLLTFKRDRKQQDAARHDWYARERGDRSFYVIAHNRLLSLNLFFYCPPSPHDRTNHILICFDLI